MYHYETQACQPIAPRRGLVADQPPNERSFFLVPDSLLASIAFRCLSVCVCRYLGDCGYTPNNTITCPVDALDGTCSGHGKCNVVTDQVRVAG